MSNIRISLPGSPGAPLVTLPARGGGKVELHGLQMAEQ
jgi:hypothetical protein